MDRMSFRDIDIRPQYDSITDDVYGDFFNPILKLSKHCARMGGKFTSRNLAACAEGMQEFIEKDGKMELVMLPEFKDEDVESINRGTAKVEDVVADRWIKDFSEITEKFVKDHVKALAWMLANDYLEIRVVVPIKSDGSVISNIALQESQVFRKKTGLFWDCKNEPVSFSGNIEYDDKLLGEYYYFRVYRGWDESEKKYVEQDYAEFDAYWDGRADNAKKRLKSIRLPDAIKDSLIRIAPKSKSEIQIGNMPKLRPYQKEAVKKWAGAGFHGMFEMATGTGKTFAAIGCIEEMRKRCKKMLVVVACPFDNLERQWAKVLAKWGIESQVTSGRSDWQQRMKDRLATLRLSDQGGMVVVITSYQTLHADKFVKIIEQCKFDAMLVADEVHNAGSSSHLNGLSNSYSYRLGLSATVERYYDQEGTAELQSFFGDTVFEMDIKQAIDHKFLVGYNYYPMYVDLSEPEYQEYKKQTRIIAINWSSKKPEERKHLEIALHRRSRIILNAESKISAFCDWANRHSHNMKHTLVYCSEIQMPKVKQILSNNYLVNREITAENPRDPRDRATILQKFSDGNYNAIVANKVLDEGADIPAAQTCIMLASTGNPKQFIQRRGRVLRRFPQGYSDGSQKDHADIYDMIVMPNISESYTPIEIDVERRIAASQIKRQEIMAAAALNKNECMEKIQGIKIRLGI